MARRLSKHKRTKPQETQRRRTKLQVDEGPFNRWRGRKTRRKASRAATKDWKKDSQARSTRRGRKKRWRAPRSTEGKAWATKDDRKERNNRVTEEIGRRTTNLREVRRDSRSRELNKLMLVFEAKSECENFSRSSMNLPANIAHWKVTKYNWIVTEYWIMFASVSFRWIWGCGFRWIDEKTWVWF